MICEKGAHSLGGDNFREVEMSKLDWPRRERKAKHLE